MVTLNKIISKYFSLLGFQIGKRPILFISLSILITCVLSTGLWKFKYRNDIEIYTISNGMAEKGKYLVNEYFPSNSSHKFSPSRIVNPGRFARLVVSSNTGGSIMNENAWSEIKRLDTVIREIFIEKDGIQLNYSQLCASWNEMCYHNEHLGIGNIIDQIENGSVRLSYPIMFNPISFEVYTMDLVFGGIVLDENSTSTVKTIQATRLHYFLKNETIEDGTIGLEWERAVVVRLQELDDDWNYISVAFDTHMTVISEGERSVTSAIPPFTFSVMLMLIFTAITSLTDDWVTSKPLVALMGVFSANLGVLAGFGVMCFAEVEFISMNQAVPFIALGVGVDDVFVILAAWRKTSPDDSVPDRMAHCYSEAAVSITITTLTDVLSFYVGLITPILSIQIFCAYAGTCLIFIYILHIFFFGGILALSGYHEKEGRHSLFIWRKVDPSQKRISGWLSSYGHSVEHQSQEKTLGHGDYVNNFFRNSFAPLLTKKSTQFSILLVYLLYILTSIHGIFQIQEGVEMYNLVPDDSYMGKFYHDLEKYFSKYPQRSQVVVTSPLDYSLKETQNQINALIGNLTHSQHGTTKYTENWLTDYLKFLENYDEFYNFNITTEQDFIDTLRSYYLTDKMVASEDVKFNENFTKIIATRYIVQFYNGSNLKSLAEYMVDHRQIVESFKEEFNVTVFTLGDILAESTIDLQLTTIKLVAIAALIVFAITILFIPSFTSSICVFLSIASVEVGVLGFMALWNINLDIVSFLTLIMCVGFSVDFPAHVCYSYVSSAKYITAEDRIKDTLGSLGFPILQGTISTILAASGLITQSSYSSVVFYKIVVLIMIFSVFNALLVLPTFLLLLKPTPSPMFSKTKMYIVNS